MKKIFSLLCVLTLLFGVFPIANAAEETGYTYLGDMYTVTSTNSDNTYAFTDAQAYADDISLHFVHGDNADPLKMQIGTGDSRLAMSSSYGGMIEPTIIFKAKGTLPTSATLSCAWTNGSINATRDVTWSEGEADANGWRDVRFNMGHLTLNNPGMYGGHAIFTLSINGSADFYMDDINISYTPWTSGWVAGANVGDMLSAHDNSFENIYVPAVSEEWDDVEYSEEDKESLTLLNEMFTISGENAENWGAFNETEAYDGDVSLHLVHKKTNADKLSFRIGASNDKLQNTASGYAVNMTGTLKFYAKGNLPDTAVLRITLTNGRLTYNVSREMWTVGEEDENGWKLVTISGTGTYRDGFYGGYVDAYLDITSQADFYIDKVTLDWSQGGNSSEIISAYGHDGSFEDVFRVVEWEDNEYTYADKKSMVIESGMYTVSGSNNDNWGSFRNDESYEGDVSLHLVHPKTNADTLTFKIGKSNAELQNVASSITTQMTADFKFYAKGNLPDNAVLRITMTNGKLVYNVSRELWTVGAEDANGWKLVTISGTGTYLDGFYGGYLDAYLDIKSQADFYMDAISLDWSQGGNSGELLSVHQPGFEDAIEVVVAEKDYSTTNLYVYPTESSLMLSWKNPKANSLKSVKLYDITDGKEIDLTEEYAVSQENNVNFNMKIKDLEKGDVRYFVIVCSFEDHDDTYFTFGAKTEAGTHPAVSGWSRETYSDNLGYTPIKPYVYTGEAHSGNASLRVIANQKNPVPGNNYVTFMAAANISQDKTYQFSFWTKGDAGTVAFYNHWTAMDGKSSYSISSNEISQWHQEVWKLTAPQTKTIRMNFESGSGYFLIDDIELYELDAEGNPTGDNLLANGGFESGVDVGGTPDAISEVKVSTEIPAIVNVAWDIPGTTSKVNVYKKINDEYILQAVIPADRKNIDIRGLVCDEENTLAVSVINSSDLESEKYEFVVTPKSSDYIVSDVALKQGNQKLNTLTEGNLTVTANIKNNHMGEGFTAELVCVLYKDGVLEKVFANGEVTIPELAACEKPQQITLDNVIVPSLSDGEYKLKICIWNSFEIGKVLSPMVMVAE